MTLQKRTKYSNDLHYISNAITLRLIPVQIFKDHNNIKLYILFYIIYISFMLSKQIEIKRVDFLRFFAVEFQNFKGHTST